MQSMAPFTADPECENSAEFTDSVSSAALRGNGAAGHRCDGKARGYAA
jgi:hypothetical protein